MNLRNLFGMGGTDDFKSVYDNGAIVVDVRTPQEYEMGCFTPSKNIPMDTISDNMDFFKNAEKPIILVCRSGGRAGTVKNQLASVGVEALNGGGWDSFEAAVNS